jgi:hypothetical protein
MNLRSINGKRVVDGKVVMTEPYVVFFQETDVIVEHEVVLREEGRPDLIALRYYGDHNLTDLILKFNGISNPFALSEGDIVEVPIAIESFKKFIKPTRTGGETSKDKFIRQRRMTQKDIKRLDFLQKVAEREALPPNRLKTGQVNKDAISKDITDLNGNLFSE